MTENQIKEQNSYIPPTYEQLQQNYTPTDNIDAAHRLYHQVPSNFSHHTNDQAKTTFKLIQIEDRLTSFTVYIVIIWILLVLSVLSLFKSILFLSEKDDDFEEILAYYRNYEIFNFFMSFGHIIGYFYGIQSFTKQKSQMNKYFEMVLLALAVVNLVYLIIFIYVKVIFITWCVALFFLIFNVILFFQTKELTIVLTDKEIVNIRRTIQGF
jgi:hypothetical protein